MGGAAAAEDEGEDMKIAYICGILCAGSVALALPAPQSAPKPQAPQSAPKAQVVQKTFDTAKQAVDALIAAAAAFDAAALESIFGSDGRDLALTEDAVQDKNRAEEFAAKAHERTFIAVDPANANRVTLSVGTDGWPFPVPIVRRSGRWSFDTKAGRQEVINRRVGGNELDAIEICRGFVEAQHEYALSKRDGAAVNQYAAAHHQHAGQAGWPGVAERGRFMGRAGRRRRRAGHRPGLR